MSSRNNTYNRNKKSDERKEATKDDSSKRINLDNARVDKIEKTSNNRNRKLGGSKRGRTKADWDKGVNSRDYANAIMWYAHNPELLKAAASIPFSTTVGQKLMLNPNPGENEAYLMDTVPGVMALNWIPMFGSLDLDALNSSASSIYSFVVHANSRNTKYEAADLMQVILAGAMVFCAIGAATRAYGTMRYFDQRNEYLPQGLVRAMGFNYFDLRNNLSQMWFDINELIARSTQIWVPNTLPFLDRWYWLNSNVYKDAESVKAQYYVFTQDKYFMLNETGFESGGALSVISTSYTPTSPVNFMPFTMHSSATTFTGHKWSEFKAMINALLDALLLSEDRGTIMGDMLKAYGSDKIYALQPVPVDYMITPTYNAEVLSQIENAMVMQLDWSAITQSNGRLEYTWANWLDITASQWYSVLPERQVLNFHQPEVPTPEQVMVATRLKPCGTTYIPGGTTGTGLAIPKAVGTELVVWTGFVDQLTRTANDMERYVTLYNGQVSISLDQFIPSIQKQEAFDWSPWIYIANQTDITATTYVNAAIGDYDNYTIVDSIELAKLHNTAVYSEFGVPTI